MVEFIRNPRVMVRAKHEVRNKFGHGRSMLTGSDTSELNYLQMVMKESLRLHPAVALILRASQESCHVIGYDIPQGMQVFINAFAIARDPQHWDDAEQFKPERFEGVGADIRAAVAHLGFIPFGAGRRQCSGALLATTTIEIALANLLYYFDWTLPHGESLESLDMSEVLGISTHRHSDLYLHVAFSGSGVL
uniref:Cytochrome P450 n=1 Tax=Oryza brachyantha TaxID=4533 RepID=J3LPZ4_ORYBR